MHHEARFVQWITVILDDQGLSGGGGEKKERKEKKRKTPCNDWPHVLLQNLHMLFWVYVVFCFHECLYTNVRNALAKHDTGLNTRAGNSVISKAGTSRRFIIFSPHMHFRVLSKHNPSLVRKEVTLEWVKPSFFLQVFFLRPYSSKRLFTIHWQFHTVQSIKFVSNFI